MQLIGLTGSFLTGKTEAAKFFRKKKVMVLSADEVYQRLLLRDKSLKKKLIKEFGEDILRGKKISKACLRNKIKGLESFKKLNKITHPYIIKEIKAKLSRHGKRDFIVVEAPLLYEAKLAAVFDKVIVISAPKNLQLKRARLRGYTREQARRLMKNQLALSGKEKKADFIIRNNSSKKEFRHRLENLYHNLLKNKN